jgi:hypothetical protein
MTLVRIGALRSRSNDAEFTALTQLLDLSDLRINVLDIRNLIRVGTVQQSCNSPFERGDSVRKIVPARPQRGSDHRISRVERLNTPDSFSSRAMSSSMIRTMRSRSLIKALVCTASFEPLSRVLHLRSWWCFILELQCSGLAQSSRSGPRLSQEPCQLPPASWLRARAMAFKNFTVSCCMSTRRKAKSTLLGPPRRQLAHTFLC